MTTFDAHATHRSMQSAIGRKFPRFPTFAEQTRLIASCAADRLMIPTVDAIIFEPARKIARELQGKNIPAADLTNEQKCALFTLAGFMGYENGRMVSIRPVGITDRGDGGYLLAIAPETRP